MGYELAWHQQLPSSIEPTNKQPFIHYGSVELTILEKSHAYFIFVQVCLQTASILIAFLPKILALQNLMLYKVNTSNHYRRRAANAIKYHLPASIVPTLQKLGVLDEGGEVMRVSFEVSLLIDPRPKDLTLSIFKVLVYLLLQRLCQGPHSQKVDLAALVLLVDLAQVLLLQLDHPALDPAVVLGEAGRGVGSGVGARGVDEGVALGEVSVGVFQVVAHLILKLIISDQYYQSILNSGSQSIVNRVSQSIVNNAVKSVLENVRRSVLDPVGSFEGIFEFVATEFAVVIFIHGVDKLNDFELGRRMLLAHVKQGVLDQFVHFLPVQIIIVVTVVLLEDKAHCFLNLFSGVPQLVVIYVALVLHVLTVESCKRPLVLLERRVRTLGLGRL